ncbi:class I SAM-dependent methyltransferase [Arthrobacter sp. CDRTa11]|uniref:class I SAM-dependent methyltransferase n=1 Tax=Arthrobacter sp. CDRTa11 TaxID=2651199 RepID=UPI002265EB44|nr:class I SAM-dependent methyltransferase [Arthrobacter sp. CDRTa11]UZX01934.1 class I SAM-dependent methyltransferase [Arthrobacter sp. CDRTa11]
MVQKAERVAGPHVSGRSRPGKPVGNVTRGTTSPNRMRRLDRWLTGPQAWRLRTANDPLVVDLGYGATPATAVELFQRLAAVRPDVRVCGIEIEPERVRVAKALERPGLAFMVGGFELPVPGNPVLVRAFNVLRQYEEADVGAIWRLVQGRLSAGGLFIDGTCDEIGRRVAWIALDAQGPLSLSISMRFGSFVLPSEIAERLPKALIHRNVPGERIHALMQAMDRAWLESAPLASFGNRQRWQGMCKALLEAGWPVQDGPARWRLGELTVGWEAVAPPAQEA